MKLKLRMNRKTLITCCATALLCVVSIMMPEVTLAIRDSARANRVESIETDEVALSILTELTTTQKLKLAGDASATEIPLAAGRSMDADGVEARIRGMAGIEGMDFTMNADARLRVGADGSALILWRAEAVGQDWMMSMTLDDSTGAVLGLIFRVKQESREWSDDIIKEAETVYPPDPDASPDLGEPPEGSYNESVTVVSMELWELAHMFLDPLGLAPYDFTVTGRYSVLVDVDEDGDRLPVTVVQGEEVYININM